MTRTVRRVDGGQWRRVVAGLGAAAALVMLMVGVPWGLVTFTEWPITGLPSGDQLRDLPTTAATDTVIVGTFVVATWAAWLVFVLCVVLEALAQVSGGAPKLLPGAGVLQGSARRLVASVAMTIASLPSLSSQRPALAQSPAPVVAAADGAATESARSADPAEAGGAALGARGAGWEQVNVGSADTVWDLAERYYGDGTRGRRLWEDNRHQVQPDGKRWSNEADPIEPGWVLRVPSNIANGAALPADDGVVAVQPGDHLWSIAEDQLVHQLGRRPTPDETASYWQLLVDTNRDRLASGNPDLIYRGEQILVPPLPSVEAPSARPEPPPRPVEPPAPPAPPPTTSVPPATTTTTTSTTTATTVPPASDPAPTTPVPGQTAPESAPAPETSEDSEREGPGVIVPVGVTAAVAALTLHVLARRRRARRRSIKPGTETPLRPPWDLDMEHALSARAGDALDRAWSAVRQLANPLRALADPPAVMGLLVNADGDVLLWLSSPAAPAEPFLEHPDDPTLWWLPADTDDPHREADEVPVLETLVAVGSTDDGSEVFVDLESLGVIVIDGDPDSARALLRSFVAELALQPLNHCVDMIVAGDIRPPQAAAQGVVTVDRLDETLVRQIERTADDTATFLADEQTASTAVGRAIGLPRDALAPVVVAADQDQDSVLLHRLAKAASPGGWGLTLVAIHPLDPPAIQLLVPGDGTIRIPHLGITARAPALGDDDVETIDGLVDREPETVTAADAVGLIATVDADSYEAPDWHYCVRVFADCRVEQPDGTVVSFRHGENPVVPNRNTARGPELLAYLALRPERSATFAEIRDHLWWTKPVNDRTIHPLLTGTRRVLGGTAYLSHAEGHPSPRRYDLGPTVVTDVDLIDHAHTFARAAAAKSPDIALAVIEPHLARLEAPAFRDGHLGAGIAEWAAANRIHDRIELPVINAALLAAALHQARGDEHHALRALDQALTVTPTNEALIRAAMVTEAKADNREGALRRYQALATELARDELEPEPETSDLRKRIMGGDDLVG